MYKMELIKGVAFKAKLNELFVHEVIQETLDAIAEELKGGGTVVVTGFGTFYTRKHPGGQVKHIRTGEVIKVPPRREVAFRPADALKSVVRGHRR